jgi:rare lipoprotein A
MKVVKALGVGLLLLATQSHAADTQVGISSYYWEDKRVATGARFDPDGMTAAHRTMPFGATIHVTNLSSGRSASIIVNDRGPYVKGRILDLSRGSARALQVHGLARVRIDVVSYGRHEPLTPKFQAHALAKLEKVTALRRSYEEKNVRPEACRPSYLFNLYSLASAADERSETARSQDMMDNP